ncbi:hypothetical protein VN97_g12373, partial [Penicillium thymicola]
GKLSICLDLSHIGLLP